MAKKKGKSKTRVKAGTSKASAEQRRIQFVDAYIANGENGKEAAVEAGFSPKTAAVQASQLLKDLNVQALLAERRKAASEASGLKADLVLRELRRICLFDPRKLFNDDGSPKAITEIDDDTAAALAGLEVLEEFRGSGENKVFIGYTKKYRIAGKVEAIGNAMKHLGLFKEDNSQRADAVADLLTAIDGRSRLTPQR